MATYSRRERVTRYVEYVVPADPAYGADWVEIDKALTIAAKEYRQKAGLPVDIELHADVLRFFPGDEEIVIRFEIQELAMERDRG